MNGMSSYRRRLMAGAYPKGEAVYLYFEAMENCTFTLTIAQYVTTTDWEYVEYSLDDGVSWTKANNVDGQAVNVTTPTINAGDRVLWRGKGECTSNSSNVNSVRASIFGSSGRYKIGGMLMSLLLGESVRASSRIQQAHTFSGLFRDNSKLVSAEDLILAKNLEIYSYSQLFQNCTGLQNPPKSLPALIKIRCYSSMFENCDLTTTPALDAYTMINGCYYRLFYGNDNVSYIRMLAVDSITANACLTDWVNGVAASGIFVKHIDAQWNITGSSGVPSGWTIIYYDPALDKYYLDQQRQTECDDHGNPI